MATINALADLLGSNEPVSNALYQRNQKYAQAPSAMTGSYLTQLAPLEEMAFREWVKKNKVPFDPSPQADYDMRGFYKSLASGDGKASSGMNSNDGKLHFTDYFKTPFHESFSAESRYAKDGAPNWNESDQLVTPGARIIFDERAMNKK